MMWYGYGDSFASYGPGFWWMGIIFHVFWILFWIFLGIGLLRLVFGRGRRMHLRGGHALEVLEERYARGEIDKKEFEEKKKDLS